MTSSTSISANTARPLEWKPRALRELYESFEHIAADDPQAARRILQRLRIAAGALSQHPLIGRKGRAPKTREFPVARTPYLLVYRVFAHKLVIGRVLHHSRRYP